VVRQGTGTGATASYAYTGTGTLNTFITATVRKVGCALGIPFRFDILAGGTIEATMIGGADVMCWGSTTPAFTLQGDIPTGANITWTVSPCILVANCTETGLTFNLIPNANQSGWATITADINAGCTSNTILTRQVWINNPVTAPRFISQALENADGDLQLCPNEAYTVSVIVPNEGKILEFEYTTPYCVSVISAITQGNHFYMHLSPVNADCYDYIYIRAKNSCGWGPYRLLKVYVNAYCSGGGVNPCGTEPNGLGRPCDHLGFSAYANPFHDNFRVRIDGLDLDENTIDDNTLAGFQYEIRVYDKQGVLKRQTYSDKVQTLIDMQTLPTDTYHVTVLFGGGVHSVSKQVMKR
jgi:hypothetical protein